MPRGEFSLEFMDKYAGQCEGCYGYIKKGQAVYRYRDAFPYYKQTMLFCEDCFDLFKDEVFYQKEEYEEEIIEDEDELEALALSYKEIA